MEVERIHSVRVSSTARTVPLDGIENDDGLPSTSHGALVGDVGSGVANLFVAVRTLAAHKKETQGRKGRLGGHFISSTIVLLAGL